MVLSMSKTEMSKREVKKLQNRPEEGQGMPLVERLRADLRSAMKARQNGTVTALRKMLSTIDNAGAVEVDTSYVPLVGITKDVPRRELSDEQLLDLLRIEADERRSALAEFERLGKPVEAEQMRLELDLFARYL
jgi:uncharacterized protein YqeY